LFLSFGEAKERKERNLPGGKAYHSFLFLETKKRSKRKAGKKAITTRKKKSKNIHLPDNPRKKAATNS
jgi:hypothetical protein